MYIEEWGTWRGESVWLEGGKRARVRGEEETVCFTGSTDILAFGGAQEWWTEGALFHAVN